MCSSLTEEEKMMLANNKKMQNRLKTRKAADNKVMKILLLGTGESGKSTIFKQMQILYCSGFTDAESSNFTHVLQKNCLECIQELIRGAEDFEYEFENKSSTDDAETLIALDPLSQDYWSDDTAERIDRLWKEEDAIKDAFENRNKLQLLDSCPYLLDNVLRFNEDDFKPNNVDVLKSRMRTSGIVERTFDVDKDKFKFMDVGGQKNERRKWIHAFESVTAILFIVAISEFDQVLYEDDTKNRMKESMEVFQKICSNKVFKDTAIILLFNKHDVFVEKLKKPEAHDAIKEVFPEYKGETQEDAENYIADQYHQLEKKSYDKLCAQDPSGQQLDRFDYRFTTATDTGIMGGVIDKCRDIILQHNLNKNNIV